MVPWLRDDFGNPSSLHQAGRRARAAIDTARESLSGALGCEFGEVVFTSGGSEAMVTALVGTALVAPPGRRRVMISRAEHQCAIGVAPILQRLGLQADWIEVDSLGRPRLDHIEELLRDDVLLVCTMHANNEVGSITNLNPVMGLCRRHGAYLLVDAVQSFGTDAWPSEGLSADLVAISGHKVNGPKGVGALLVRAGTKLGPIFAGGGQEREMRGGTENVAGIAGLGVAVAHFDLGENRRLARDAFLTELRMSAPNLVETIHPCHEQMAGHAHFRFPGVQAETLLIRLDRAGVAASTGSACSSGSLEPSHVLTAMGWTLSEAKEALRFTFGRSSTVAEAQEGARRLVEAVEDIRQVTAS